MQTDTSIANALAPVLASLRQKLLDLTTRNRLLAFSHKTAACLRVVDELPDQLFEGLLEGRDFGFAAVPEPSERELKAYHAADQAAPRADGDQEGLTRPKAEIWAQHCGIEADYELPIDQGAERPDRHRDRVIQTLFYPDDMDRRLRKLRTDARTAVEETGSNLLHLAFGFLEWRDRRPEARSHLAPLLLVPVELERRTQRGGRHSYRLSYSGEDLQANLSLEKKLDEEFGITLPPLDEQETPEGYMRKLRGAIEGLEGWRVRRHVTLALFQFGKQLLYRDLDPDSWPKGQGLADSALVQRLLLGDDAGGSLLATAEPFEPTPDEIDLELELVERSDSSQSTALLRALAGESLVIQGPPGTGKSQSITNLIAGALARGKSLLFVSEKLAALEVVRRRLDEAGLGDFVLELHSHKTRKQALLQDLNQRLAAGDRLRPPRQIGKTRDALVETRKALQAYAQAVRAPFGALDWPVSDIFFQAGRSYRRLGACADRLPQVLNLDPMTVTAAERAFALECLGSLAALAKAAPEPDLSQHPWAGISSQRVFGEADRRAVLAIARDWRERLQAFEEAALPLRQELALPLHSDLTALFDLAEERAALRLLRDQVSAAEPLAERLRDYLSCETLGPLGDLAAASAVLRLAGAAPQSPRPREGLQEEATAPHLATLSRIVKELLERRQHLQRSFGQAVERCGDAADLRALARVLQDAGAFSWLSGRYRRARRQALAISTAGLPLTKQPGRLLEAAQLLEEEGSLLAETRDFGLASANLAALQAALAEVAAWRDWNGEIEAVFGRGLAERAAWGRALKALDASGLADLAAAAVDPSGVALLALEAPLSGLPAEAEPWRALLQARLSSEQSSALSGLPAERLFDILDRFVALSEPLTEARAAEAAFAERVDLDTALWRRQELGRLQRLELALGAEKRLAEWLEVDHLLRQADAAALQAVMQEVLYGRLSPGLGQAAYEHLLFGGLARAALEHHPVLKKRSGEQDKLRAAFKDSDEALMEAQAQAIAAKLAGAAIPQGRSGKLVSELTDLQLVRHEVAKQKRHIPIRQLLRRAGPALQALKPCFMMGPQSVAQYLEPGALSFDLVIFDEASQVRPEEAIGALARARQAVIVGDAKQLPPTSFFQRTGEGRSDEETPLAAESESILETAEQRFRAVMLRWHYRSLHPHLIAFSNARFYDGRLHLFPSASRERADFGLSFERVTKGCFAKGRNQVEAERVAEEAVAHLLQHPTQSLGVVAMNVEQRDLIAELIEGRIDAEPALSNLDDEGSRQSEPFFVKNLENVQGDERDVIMISMTYGPMEPGGRVAQRFGPINQDNGWRRLNVLFSRAKQRMRILSSLGSADVMPGEGSGRGLIELKAFLAFAETRVLEDPARLTGKSPDSDFEVAVIEGLEERGFRCEPQIGQAGFFIDIGVVDPEQPGRFLAGVECDGANYHSSRSARDRDHLRQAVLERLGWRILRVWSTDWFLDPNRSLDRLVSRLEGLKRSEAEPPSRPAPKPQLSLPGLEEPEEGPDLEAQLPEVLSERDARARLIDLRERIQAEHPDRDRAKGLLRKSMLEELLRKRPANEEAFRRQIRRDLREATNGEDLKRYGSQIFAVLERIA